MKEQPKYLYIIVLILLLTDIFVKSNINNYVTLADIAFVIFVISNLIESKGRINVSVNFKVTTLYFLYFIILSSVMMLLNVGITYISYLYIIKEIIYLSAFYMVIRSYRVQYKYSERLIKYFIISSLIYGTFMIITGQISHYGIGSIVSPSPSHSGIVYLVCFFISFIYFLEKRKKIFLVLSIISSALVLATISRTAIVGLAIFILTYMILFLLNTFRIKLSIKSLVIFMSIVCLLIIIPIIFDDSLLSSDNIFINAIYNRFTNIFNAINTRSGMSKNYYNEIIGDSVVKLFFGQGKSIPEVITGKAVLAVDNQYTRFILEGGIIGLVLWLTMIGFRISFIKKSMNILNRLFLFSFIMSYAVMGLGYEVFQVSKGGISFWFVLGVLFSNSNVKKNVKGLNQTYV